MTHFFSRITLALSLIIGIAHADSDYQFELVGPDEQIITETSFPDHYILLAFGFTNCPDVCPTTLYDMKQMLAKINNPDNIQPIFITIDPKRDDVPRLNEYVDYFDPRIIGLGGTREAIDAAVESFSASYGYQLDGKKLNPDELPDGAYTVYHSTYIYLLDNQGNLLDVFDYQSGADNLTQGIEAAVSANPLKE
ncbi:SCO family protein [Suttonella sp. R2A3]|uniref:SCO family protein n=1 Tax=Suttonella sp. R2A3 TaxID=2908648 RepID=UPI001F1DE059|nr:SCO family protein [Suttonella sp. R2A3]UJF24540.1 SCO family protein [Suttonella sp. R2A3]